MQSTTKDLRYLEAKEKFLYYAFLAVGHHFYSHENFNSYFDSIASDSQKKSIPENSIFLLVPGKAW